MERTYTAAPSSVMCRTSYADPVKGRTTCFRRQCSTLRCCAGLQIAERHSAVIRLRALVRLFGEPVSAHKVSSVRWPRLPCGLQDLVGAEPGPFHRFCSERRTRDSASG